MAQDPFRYFRIEAREILEKLSQGVLALEKTGGDVPELEIERLLRSCHTLKGAAAVVRQEIIARHAHDLETELTAQLRGAGAGEGAGKGPRIRIEILLGFVDAIRDELAVLGQAAVPAPAPVPPPPPSTRKPATAPLFVAPIHPAHDEPLVAESVRLDLAEVDGVLAMIADVTARIEVSRVRAGGLERLETMARSIEAELHDRPNALDKLHELRHALRAERELLGESLERAERRGLDALEGARGLRLMPAEALFGELARAARDAAAMANRSVALETSGGDQRIDAHVLHLLRDALLQIVRNVLAHGIEPAEQRIAAGKPAVGRITIHFARRGLRARVTLRDDGAGIDEDAVRAALVAKQIISAEDAAPLDANGLMNLVMRHGVSTRAEATALAGRGVGLRVVADVVDRLRGEFRIESERGVGASFELDVPVSVTAAPALLVDVGSRIVTIPLDAVTRTERIAANDIVASPSGDSVSEGGESVRFASLARVLKSEHSAPTTWTVVHLIAGDRRAAIGVDRILGVANEVVLPLPEVASGDPMIVGASLDGAGDPRLALDPTLLVEAVRSMGGAPKNATTAAQKRVLVIDDSLTSRMLEQSILEAAGYEVTTAASGEQGLELALGRGPFDLFVVDVEMPGINGFEVVARTRNDPALMGTPAVLVTSLATPEDRRRGLEAGARAYIVKGEFAQDDFLDAVRRLTG